MQAAVFECERELDGDGSALGGMKAGAEGVEAAAEEEKKGFKCLERVFEIVREGEIPWGAMKRQEAVVSAVEDVVQKGDFGTESLSESLTRESGELAKGIDTPERENVAALTVHHGMRSSPRSLDMTGGLQGGERQIAKGLYGAWCILCMDDGLRVNFESGAQGRAAGGEKGQVRSGGKGELEGEIKRNSLAEGLFDPVKGGGESLGKREEIEKEGAGICFFEIGSKGGEMCMQGLLMEALEDRVGGKKGELRAAGEGSRGGESGSDPVAGGGRIDSKKERCGPGPSVGRGRICLGIHEGRWTGGRSGIVTKENGEGEAGNLGTRVHSGVMLGSR